MAEGHRGRYRDRFENENIDSIPEYAVLEKLLHGVIVRQDTSELARTLIREFGSFAGVIDAPEEELLKIKGVGPGVSSFLKSIPFLYERCCRNIAEGTEFIRSVDDIVGYLSECFGNENEGKFVLLCFDKKMRLISCKTIVEGASHLNAEQIKDTVDYAVLSKASYAVIAHSHIDNEEINKSDMIMTRQIYNLLDFSSIHLTDHIVIKNGEYISMAERNMMPIK